MKTCTVALTPRAESDLQNLEEYLAVRFSERNAERFVQRIVASCHRIALVPQQGRLATEFAPGVRVKGVDKRVAIYFILQNDVISVLGITYGGQNPALL